MSASGRSAGGGTWRPQVAAAGVGGSAGTAQQALNGSIHDAVYACTNGCAGALHGHASGHADSSGEMSEVPAPLETSGGWADDIILTLPKPFLDDHPQERATSSGSIPHQYSGAPAAEAPAPAAAAAAALPSQRIEQAPPAVESVGSSKGLATRRSASGAPSITRSSQGRPSSGHGASSSGLAVPWVNSGGGVPRTSSHAGSTSSQCCASPGVPLGSVLKDSRFSHGARSASSFVRGSSAHSRERHVIQPCAAQPTPLGWRVQCHGHSDGSATPQAAGPMVPSAQVPAPPAAIAWGGKGGGRGSLSTRTSSVGLSLGASVSGGGWLMRDSLPAGAQVQTPQGVTAVGARSISPVAPDSRKATAWPQDVGATTTVPCTAPSVLESPTIMPSAVWTSAAGHAAQPQPAVTMPPSRATLQTMAPPPAGQRPPSVCVQASPRGGNMSVPFGASVARWRVSSSPRQRVAVGDPAAANHAVRTH